MDQEKLKRMQAQVRIGMHPTQHRPLEQGLCVKIPRNLLTM